MNLSSCEFPQIVPNRYTGEFQVVPCRRCNTCTTRHSLHWVQRVEQESACWKYCIFLTLTYNEEFVPYLYPDAPEYVAADDDVLLWRGYRTQACLFASDLSKLDIKSLDYLKKIDCLRVLNYDDVKSFLKRLRSKLSYLNYGKFRFFCCGEYGETTLRPHYHLVIFTNSRDFYSNCERLFIDCWTCRDFSGNKVSLGRIDCSLVQQSVASYCAGYVNGFSHLPEVLTLPKIRPFSQSSRRPPLGSLLQSSEQIQQIFNKGLATMSQWTKKGLVITPLERYIRDRLFPTVSRYSKIPSCYRVGIYDLVNRISVTESDSKNQIISKIICWLRSIDDDRFEKVYAYTISDGLVYTDVLYRWYRISARVNAQCEVFRCSLSYYLSRIELYFNNVNSLKLRQMYEFEIDYVSRGGSPSDLDVLDYLRCEDKRLLGLSVPDLFNLDDYRQMKFRSQIYYRRSSKTKKKNDYLAQHPEKCRFVYQ